MSIAVFVVLAVYSLYSVQMLTNDQEDDCKSFTLFFHIMGMLTVSALSLACIGLLSKNLSAFADIDLDGILKYVRDAKCSEGPLQVALEKGYDGLVYERMLNRLALGFIASAYIVQLIVALFFTDLKYILYLCLCKSGAKNDGISNNN